MGSTAGEQNPFVICTAWRCVLPSFLNHIYKYIDCTQFYTTQHLHYSASCWDLLSILRSCDTIHYLAIHHLSGRDDDGWRQRGTMIGRANFIYWRWVLFPWVIFVFSKFSVIKAIWWWWISLILSHCFHVPCQVFSHSLIDVEWSSHYYQELLLVVIWKMADAFKMIVVTTVPFIVSVFCLFNYVTCSSTNWLMTIHAAWLFSVFYNWWNIYPHRMLLIRHRFCFVSR